MAVCELIRSVEGYWRGDGSKFALFKQLASKASSGGHAYVFLCFHFIFMQKFRFQYQSEDKGLENNFGPSVKLSDKKIQNGCQNPK